ncbi:MAG: carboxypeptidase regulatory-like domain-containing protein, partial [Vicinamibacterales bacterium]
MVRRLNGRHFWLAAAALVALAVALPAAAQSTGMVKGVVKDATGQPVDGAVVTITMTEGVNRKFETKSNKKGEFVQIGLPSGAYTLVAEKDKQQSGPATVRVRIGAPSEANLVIGAGAAGGGLSKEAMAKNAELKKSFEEGIEASKAGNFDEAVAKFTHAAEVKPDCFDCYYNIGYMYSQKKDYDNAETAYKKAIELKADYGEAWNGLANIYNATRK